MTLEKSSVDSLKPKKESVNLKMSQQKLPNWNQERKNSEGGKKAEWNTQDL